MSKLNSKRKQVLLAISAAILGNALVAAVPSFKIETIKHLFITLSNVAMFILVWDVYFEEQLSSKSVSSVLQDLLAVTCVSLFTALIISLGIIKTVDRLVGILGSFGWITVGAIAGVATAVLGIVWASYCDDLYRNSA